MTNRYQESDEEPTGERRRAGLRESHLRAISMYIYCEKIDDCMVARISGSVDSTAADELAEVACLKEPSESVILDFTEVDFVDSTGVGTLARLIHAFEELEHKLIVSSPKPLVLKTLTITGIDRVVSVTDSVMSAVDALIDEADCA